jgi:hypothetical protein
MITRRAPHGAKTIQVIINLWTDGIAPPGHIRPRHAWNTGTVRVKTNSAHRITSRTPAPFGDHRGLKELPVVVSRVLKRAGVKLHSS